MTEDFVLPPNLEEGLRRYGNEAWLETLPGEIVRIRAQWGLKTGPPFQPGGTTAWVAPAVDTEGRDVVLKVGLTHPEARDEAAGLRFWDGDGAVRVLAAEVSGRTTALLLERCRPGTPLKARPEPEQDQVIADLLLRLWRPAPAAHPFRSLESMCRDWAEEFWGKVVVRPVDLDPGLVREGMELFVALAAGAERQVLLCTDLHADNVLSSSRAPWLMVDPKPHVGDPTYDAIQHLLNCPDRLRADPSGLVRRMAGLANLDAERLRLWLFARCVQESPGWPGLAEVARRLRPRL